MFNQLRKLLNRAPQQAQQDPNKAVGEIGGRQYNFGGDFLPPQTLHASNNPMGHGAIAPDIQDTGYPMQSSFVRGIQGSPAFGSQQIQQPGMFSGVNLQQGGQAPVEDSWNTLDNFQSIRRLLNR
jgi:hypothetical protein